MLSTTSTRSSNPLAFCHLPRLLNGDPQAHSKTTSSAKNHKADKNHKLGKKPQSRQKPQARPKTTKTAKTTSCAFCGFVVGSWAQLLPSYAQCATRTGYASKMPTAFKRGFYRAFPVSDTQCATRDPKTTSDPQDHKTTLKNHKRSTSQKSIKVSNINGLRKRSTKTTKTTLTCGHSHSHSHSLLYIYNII